jgi:hypothetical protein
LSGQQQQQSFNDSYTALILEEAEKLYNELTTKLTNRVIVTAAAAIRASSSFSLPSANNNQKLTHNNDYTYQIEEARYNDNQPEIYNNDQEQPNHSC